MPALEIPSPLTNLTLSAMPSLRLIALLLAGGLVATTGRTQQLPDSGLYGEIRNGHYTAPEGRFRVPVPVLPELGGRTFDTEAVVTFTDEVSTHISIACFPLDMSNKWELETREIRDYLAYFFSEHVYSSFVQRYPGVATERSEFTADLRGGALFVFTLLPGGSAFEGKSTVIDGAAPSPAVAKRGTLLFVDHGCIFIVSTELAERVTQRSAFHKSADEENGILRTRLIQLAHRLQVPAPRPPSRRP